MLTQTAVAHGSVLSPAVRHQRFSCTAARCLEPVHGAAVRHMGATEPVMLPVLERCTGVVVQDSTLIAVPESLATVWHDCDNGTPDAGHAALKRYVARDLCPDR